MYLHLQAGVCVRSLELEEVRSLQCLGLKKDFWGKFKVKLLDFHLALLSINPFSSITIILIDNYPDTPMWLSRLQGKTIDLSKNQTIIDIIDSNNIWYTALAIIV